MAIGISNVAPGDPITAVHRRIAELERLVRELAAAQSKQTSAVSEATTTVVAGNAITLAGGSLLEQDPSSGAVLFRVGAQQFGDLGAAAYRSDGTVVWRIAKAFSASDSQQVFIQYDRLGKIIGGDAQMSPTGFDSPHLHHSWRPLDRSDAKTTTSSAFVSLFEHRGIRGNPGIPVVFSVQCSDSTTAGQVQVIDATTGTVLAPLFGAPWVGSIPAGTTTELIVNAPPLAVPGNAGDAITLQVQANRTAGSGSVSVAIAGTTGGGL